ncbi:DEAD/DEAH box helicase family protein [Faecousia sp. CLA-AA-H192]|uniref:DEAD/DEAH box helicase family protein n=1 Tax=Faecousia intestinalis TaxID=3133167 RepID=A0ABV1G7W5_9FIRM
MELNNYQKQVMRDLSAYLNCVNRSANLFSAWREYWFSKDVAVGLGGVPSYNNSIECVPHVCMKVPTGGGKTFMACASVKRIFDALPTGKPQVVVWLVPSDSILTQTIRTLSDVNHPYRQKLDQDFAGRVGVYTKEMLLNGQNFSPDTVREMLMICIMSYSSLRINSRNRDVRKVYQENGNLFRFSEYFKDKEALLADTPDTALIQVLRHLEPVVVVDESHNAGSDLSTEMLNNLNPSFVLDLTATPRKNSNIISYVDARELKKEHMVKLPVVVYNRTSRQSVIQDAIQLRGSIEREVIAAEVAGGQYIRPIVLFQAQPRTGDSSDTFDKIKAMLIDMGIPEAEIAVKTSNVDDLKGKDLMSKGCPIRYIITVNALKEGWDCPFAYILASLANRTSTVDVEQILSRILRQPYATQHASPLLNTSYVLTNSVDFHSTLEKIVVGLNRAGFSRKDYRIGETIHETS